MLCNYLFRPPFFCDQWSLYLLHRALTYFGSIFNGIIRIILDVGTCYDFIWIELPKGTKSRGTFEIFFSYFGPFRVWGMTLYPLTPKGYLKKTHFLALGANLDLLCERVET